MLCITAFFEKTLGVKGKGMGDFTTTTTTTTTFALFVTIFVLS